MATIKHKRGTSNPSTSNVAVGELAINTSDGGLFTQTDGGSVVEIGGGGVSSDAQNNTVAGTDAGNSFSGTSAINNTCFGESAGTGITTGDGHTAIGAGALRSITTQDGSTAVGFEALYANTTGNRNQAFGWKAGQQNIEGWHNTYLGYETGRYAKGYDNVFIGYQAGMIANDTECHSNTGIGTESLRELTTGDDNTAVGIDAGNDLTTGSKNVCLGSYAGDKIDTGSNNIVIGYNAAASAVGQTNEITLGDTNITKFRIPGINFVVKDNGGTPSDGQVLTADGSGEASWEDAAGGGGATEINVSKGFEAPATVPSNWTIGSANNAMFPGPMTVASGATITVPANRTLTVV